MIDSIWDTVGDNLQTLRASGVTVPFADIILATIAITNDDEFWTRDAHFALIQRALPARRLFHKPP